MASSGLSWRHVDGKQSRKLSRRRSCRSGIIQIPRIAVREALRAGRLMKYYLATVPSRSPFRWFIRSSGAFPACKPVYAVAGWRNDRHLD